MPDFSLEDLAVPVAAASPNFAVKVAAGALVFGCGLYRDYPGAMVGNNPSAFARGLMDTLCDDRVPLPPPPVTRYPVGGCDGELYNATITFNTRFPSDTTVEVTVQVWGKVGNFVKFSNDFSTAVITWESRGTPAQFSSIRPFGQYILYSDSQYRIKESNPNIQIVSLARVNGQPDNCGVPTTSYPPSVIPPERTAGDVNIIYNDGGSFSVPLVYAPVSFSAPLTINAGGVNFRFDFGGLTIGDDAGVDVINNIAGDVANIAGDTTVIRNDLTLTRQDVNTINNTVNKTEGDVSNVVNKVNTVNNYITNAPIPPEQITEEPPTEDPEKENVSNLFAVRVKLTIIPSSAKMQFGVGAPNVLYAGWFEFRRGAFCFPREPIAFEEGIFRAPIGADGYAYTLYVGYKGEASVIKLDLSEPVEV